METILTQYNSLIKTYIVLQSEKEKIRTEKLFKLVNGEDIGIATAAIDLKEIKYDFYNNKKFVFTINYTENGVSKIATITKQLPDALYNKTRGPVQYYLVFLYSVLNFDSGHFWGLNPRVYDAIKRLFPHTIECFASPFNNNLTDFYSVLYPIDRYYGSKGDFFTEFPASKYDAYVINPPFVETIIERVQALIKEKLVAPEPVAIFYYIPTWNDLILPWYESVAAVEKNIRLLDINKSFVYDYINRKNIRAKFATYFIYLANYKNNVDLDKVLHT